MRMILLASICLLLFGNTANAQSNEEKLKTKLEKPFVKKVEWVHDYGKALDQSRKTGKPIFAYFTRSYSP